MLKIFLHTLLVCLNFSYLIAQNVQIIGNPINDEFGYSVASDALGNAYIGGTKDLQGLVTKVDADGNIVWSKTFVLNTLPSQNINVTYLEVVGDTLFGCGWINSGTTLLGSHYFKMDASNGNFYWAKSETSSNIYYSCMRYNAGQFYLAGSQTGSGSTWDGKLLCVSSATGNIIWQNGTWGMTFPAFGTDYVDDMMAMSEVVDGKFFLAGRSYVNGSPVDMRPTLIGFDLSGNMILNKYLLMDETDAGVDRFYGMDIKFEGTDSLVIAFFGDDNCTGSCLDCKVGLIKTDINGNVSVSKTYDIVGSPMEIIRTISVTDDAYVIYGGTDYIAANSDVFVLKTDKNGVFQTATVISKTSSTLRVNPGTFSNGGASSYNNSIHSFTGSIYTTDPNVRNILLVRTDENLQSTNDCFTFTSPTVITQNYTPFSADLQIINKTNVITAVSGVTDQVYTLSGCGSDDITLGQVVFGCDSVNVTVTSLTGTVYEITWSTGATGNSETFYGQDTAVIDFFNPVTCCAFSDTVIVELANTFPEIILPADTSICINSGTLYEIAPLSNLCTTCGFEWNTGSTDSLLLIDTSGWYVLTVTNSCNLQDQDSVYMEVNFFPDLTAINDTLVCPSDLPVTMSAFSLSADSITWSNSTTGSSSVFSNPGIAYAEVSNACGLIQEIFVIDTIPSTGMQVQLPPDTSICLTAGTSYQLMPVVSNCGGCIYAWNGGSADSMVSVDSSGWYAVHITNSCNLSDEDSVFIEVNFFPDLSALTDTLVCPSDLPVTLSAVSAYTDSIVWSNGTVGLSTVFNNAGPGYAQAYNGCGMVQDSFLIDTIPSVNIQIIDDIDTCLYPGEVLEIPILVINHSTLISNGVVLTTPLLFVTTDSVFTVSASNSCSQDSIQFTVAMGDFPVYTMSEDIDTCVADGTPFSISVNVTNGILEWWNGSASATQIINAAGVYYFEITNECGMFADSISASYTSQPPAGMLIDMDTCLAANEVLEVSYTQSGLSVFWAVNGNDTLSITESGTYYAEVGTPCGVIFDSMTIVLYEKPSLPAFDTIHFCGTDFSISDLGIVLNDQTVFLSSTGDSLGQSISESGDYVIYQSGPCGELVQSFHLIFDSEYVFYAPNTFTPGDDASGLNNIYAFKGVNYVISEVWIFDRWGEVVYNQSGGFDGWDGTHNGNACQSGTYVVKVKYKTCDDIEKELYLHVNLLR